MPGDEMCESEYVWENVSAVSEHFKSNLLPSNVSTTETDLSRTSWEAKMDEVEACPSASLTGSDALLNASLGRGTMAHVDEQSKSRIDKSELLPSELRLRSTFFAASASL